MTMPQRFHSVFLSGHSSVDLGTNASTKVVMAATTSSDRTVDMMMAVSMGLVVRTVNRVKRICKVK